MAFSTEQVINQAAAVLALLLLIYAVDWRYFRDWVVVFLFQCFFDFLCGSPVVNLKLLEYPVRLLPQWYNTSILFEIWIFPILCILFNQIARRRRLGAIIGYALLFSAGITAVEYQLERVTNLIRYIHWSWFISFYTMTITFLLSRVFIAFFRWGCNYFDSRGNRLPR